MRDSDSNFVSAIARKIAAEVSSRVRVARNAYPRVARKSRPAIGRHPRIACPRIAENDSRSMTLPPPRVHNQEALSIPRSPPSSPSSLSHGGMQFRFGIRNAPRRQASALWRTLVAYPFSLLVKASEISSPLLSLSLCLCLLFPSLAGLTSFSALLDKRATPRYFSFRVNSPRRPLLICMRRQGGHKLAAVLTPRFISAVLQGRRSAGKREGGIYTCACNEREVKRNVRNAVRSQLRLR